MFSKLLDLLNDLKPRQLLMLAGGTAILMFAVVYFALLRLAPESTPPTAERPPVPLHTRSVVVAKTDIPARTILNAEMLAVKDVAADTIPKGAVTGFNDVVGQPAVSTIYAGDIVTVQKVFMDKAQVGFVGAIPANCRAVSVGVGSVTGVAGFARPGDHVDVLLVEKGDAGATSRMLLQDILLLGINQTTEGVTNATGKPEEPSIATLALTPDDTLRLVSAAAIGEIYLALRPFSPTEEQVTAADYTLRSTQVKKSTDKPATPTYTPPAVHQPSSAPAAPAKSSSGIKIIQGDKIVGD
ncbi:MAG: Flp pilus assembly protein CpaB [Selenomonadaceae bacterium]|nr:Flp pilus assembly protein CpaB [Selenomonadaceae bacterium]